MSSAAERFSGHRHEPSPAKDRETLSAEFRSSLALVQSRPLNPDTIDTYAEDALADLINLSISVTDRYREEEGSAYEPGRELEDTAFEYFHLRNLGEILTHVASKDAEIKHIGRIVEGAQNAGVVIVPPDKLDPPNGAGTGEFKKKSVISRTKTLLFILSNDFDVDLEDPEQFSIKTGVLTDTMMRGLSYFQIEVPGLDRTVLCCDEEGNVTYIFDNKVLKDHGITPDDISTLTKSDINDLLASDSKMGKRVVYSPKFVSRMIGLMADIQTNAQSGDLTGFYLYPEADGGLISANKFAEMLGIHSSTLANLITDLGDQLGDVKIFRFKSNLTRGLNIEQRELLTVEARSRGLLAESVPENILTVKAFAEKIHVSSQSIRRASEELKDSLGKVRKYKVGAKPVDTLDPIQQQILADYFKSKGFLVPKAPEGYLSLKNFAKKLVVSQQTISETIIELASELGEIQPYRMGGKHRTNGLSPDQQQKIENYLRQKGFFSDVAPEGFLSARGLAKKLDISPRLIGMAIGELGESIGNRQTHRFGVRIIDSLDPVQQELVEKYLRKKGLLMPKPPEDVLSTRGLAKEFNVDVESIYAAVKALGDSLGIVQRYRFGANVAGGFNKLQKEQVRNYLRERGLFSDNAPEGALALSSFAQSLGLAPQAVRKSIDRIGDAFGRIEIYRLGKRPEKCISIEQQAMVIQDLIERGLIVA